MEPHRRRWASPTRRPQRPTNSATGPFLVDEFALAERGIDLLTAEARRQGSIFGLAMARLLDAVLAVFRGALLDAEADAR
jgi:hypothetical protein